MGESMCLVRSFSQPAEISSRESNEEVTHRFLTESVSFGRFASETLQWEKWSAFTQNRYLEEVERFTRPGSVAQKKAFFEAHFKNRAAGRATQTNIEQVNAIASDEIVRKDDNLVDLEVESVAPTVSVIDETTDVQIGEVKDDTSVENFDSIAVPEGEDLVLEDSTSLSKEKRPGSSESKTCSTSSKLELSFAIGPDMPLTKTRKEPPSSSGRSISVSKNQNRSPCEPFHMSISCGITATQDGSTSSTNAKSAGNADKKKKKKKKSSGPSSVQMPLNVASNACPTTKTAAPKNLARKSATKETASSNATNSGKEPLRALKSRKRPLPQTAKDGSKAAKCSTSAPTVRLHELPPPINRLSEDKRKVTTVDSSGSCRIPHNVKRQHPSIDCENRSTSSRIKAKSLTVSSPFNFRSDERAEKRKEFFKKLEEKNKKEDTTSGKEQLFCGFKATRNTPGSLTSPRLRFNQTPGRGNNIKKSHQSPRKVAIMEKLKSCKIHPSQTKKKTQENLSPNILQD